MEHLAQPLTDDVRFHLVVDGDGGCAVVADSGREVVSVSAVHDGGSIPVMLGGEHWMFHVDGARRLRIVGSPRGAARVHVMYTGSSTSGVVLLGERQMPYRFRNPLLGRSRFEDPSGTPILVMRLRLFPRFRILCDLVAEDGDHRATVLPLLGVLALVTVLTPARPMTALLAGAPASALRRLERAMEGALPPADGEPEPLGG